MRSLLHTYGRALVGLFFGAVVLWSIILILAPQLAVFSDALVTPPRKLDSNAAQQVATDAATCRTILERQAASTAPTGMGSGIAIPQIGGATPAPAPAPTLGIPQMNGIGGTGGPRPYILQCDRATTMARLPRGPGEPAAYLAEVYGLEAVKVDPEADAALQKTQADRVRSVAEAALPAILAAEAAGGRHSLDNFRALTAAVLIPLGEEARAEERASTLNQIQRLVGLRYESGGDLYVRIGMVTLVTTLVYAALATALALVVCYPIAFNIALAARPKQAAWLLLALLVPYAVIELMRIYAWLSIVENRGVINLALQWVGLVDAANPIEFKRSPLTVFVVIVYSYILFMMFPLVNVLSTLDRAQIEAARDLGASTLRLHRRVVLPHANPGIAVGCIATFMLAAGAFSVPRIISRGLQGQWYAETIYEKFFESGAVNQGAAYAFAFTVVCFILIALFLRLMNARLSDFIRA